MHNEESKEGRAKQTETMMIYAEVEKAFGKDDDQNYQHSTLTILEELIKLDGTSSEIIHGKDRNGREHADRIVNEI